ncbi:hypothetical protein [Mesorhizobium sp. ESP-6-4]|uniref:hypothetical protein n=1 Tax=Mesorhizobium sp. ESP-6-4 TaxID=2876624 RepID=UPI001CCC8EE7|nr:hypothetical protein [Mesorhizobium sp. ESP-6-4]
MRALAAPDCPFHAIFLEGGEHYGKTFLLQWLKTELTTRVVLIPIDKRRVVPAPLQLLSEIATHLGWQHFPGFDRAMRTQQRPIQANVSNVSVEGSYVNVQAIAQESEDDRLLAAIRLTGAFLDDLRALPDTLRPLILAFDGYDASTSLIDRWFDGVLVEGLCDIEHARLIVCGRQVPSTSMKLRTPAERFIEVPLTGVADEQEWMQIIASLKCRLPGDDDVSRAGYLRGIVAAFKGAPGLILAHLKAL